MYKELRNDQIKSVFNRLRKHISIPRNGWIRLIRESYGMSTRVLAAKLGVSQSSVVQYEKNEAQKKITLSVLMKVAETLNCDFYYAFVPRKPIDEYLGDLAVKKAKRITEEIIRTMELESQNVSKHEMKIIYEGILEELRKNPKNLWSD